MGRLNHMGRLSKTVGEWLSYVYLVAVAVITYEVVARYFFNAPTIWAHESTIALTAIGFVFGGAYTMQRRGHIAITIDAQDMDGSPFTLTSDTLAARIWQHEYDHLDGITIIKRMTPMDRLTNQRALRQLEK